MVTGNRRLRVAIVGGGIGGLTAAAFLRLSNMDVRVYEQAVELKEIGAGINLDPNATRLLLRLGLAEQLREVAIPLEAVWEYRRWDDGRLLFSQPFKTEFGAPHVVLHRGDLQAILKQKVPEDTIFLDHRCVSVVQHEDVVELTFENGTSVEVDAVVGADGPHSVVRNAVLTPPPARYWARAYRSLVPIEHIPPAQRVPARTAWLGPRKIFMRYLVSGGNLLNIVAIVPGREWLSESWVTSAQVKDCLSEFEGWDEDVRHMISACPEVSLWALHDMDPLERWSLNRVTLIGDAAHFMLPFMGQGAAQAMEDAFVLAEYLKNITAAKEIPEAFRRYEAVRKPRATMLQFASRATWNFFNPPGSDPQFPYLPGGDPFNVYKWLFNMHEWLNGYDLEKDVIG